MPRLTLAPALLLIVSVMACMLALPAAAMERFTFDSIDGGRYDTANWAGQPVLVVNTASLCGFTPQYEGLQALYDRYKGRGLVVLAVPSDDFRQELGSDAEVKDFCELNYGITLPMTTITHVRGTAAHPFYRWLAQAADFQPGWNFNKVLIGPDGAVVGTWGSMTRPLSRPITAAIEPLLPK